MALLELRDDHSYNANIHALKAVSLTIDQGEIVTLIGSNAAGKSTTLKTISGLLRPREGEVWFDGQRLDGTPAHDVVAKGISQSPEGRRIFPRMTVRENLEMGAFQRAKGAEREADFERVYTLFPRLKERQGQNGGTLSGGEQQMLAIGRGLMAKPRLLLIDEASLGLAPVIVKEIFKIAQRLTEDGTTVVLVEQNVGALEVADVGYFMAQGEITAELRGKELRDTERIRRLYLG
jgi:branched-chain amino acid transport system ATP-binding protein